LSKKHNLRQIQQWARESRIGKWFNAYDVDEDSRNHKKAKNNRLANKKGSSNESKFKSR